MIRARLALALLSLGIACQAPMTDPHPLTEATPADGDSAPSIAARKPGDPGFLLGGIMVNEPDHRAWFRALRASGFNAVSVTSYAKQGDWDSANLWWEAEEPWVVEEVRGAKAAGLAVVLIPRVALDHAFPRNRFLWHGMIMPRTDAEVVEWFRRYREFVLGWARVAEAHRVDVFGIGSEMSALTSTGASAELSALEDWFLDQDKQASRKRRNIALGAAIPRERLRERGQDQPYPTVGAYFDDRIDAEHAWAVATTFGGDAAGAAARRAARRMLLDREWRALIAAVREVYSGRITYAANFDQYREVGFWDALDLVGVNAYFPLRRRPDPDAAVDQLRAELAAGWRRVEVEIDEFLAEAELQDRQVLFTELGYTRFRDMSVAPWAGDGFTLLEADPDAGGPAEDTMIVWAEQPLRPIERALAIEALEEVEGQRGHPLLAGLLWWKLTTVPSHLEIEPFALLLDSGDPLQPALVELSSATARAHPSR